MLSSRAVEASYASARWGSQWEAAGGRGTTSRWPGKQTHRHSGARVQVSTRSCKCVDELPVRIWAAAPLWAGCWCQTPQVESLGRKVIRNSCTSRWFILTLKKKCPVHKFEKIISFLKYRPQKYLTAEYLGWLILKGQIK